MTEIVKKMTLVTFCHGYMRHNVEKVCIMREKSFHDSFVIFLVPALRATQGAVAERGVITRKKIGLAPA